jgi:hypothetical protein
VSSVILIPETVMNLWAREAGGRLLGMTGKLIEFPRRLEWTETPCWVGRVKGTMLLAKVEKAVDGPAYQWGAWNGTAPLGAGLKETEEAAKEAARQALEAAVLVIRPLDQQGGS